MNFYHNFFHILLTKYCKLYKMRFCFWKLADWFSIYRTAKNRIYETKLFKWDRQYANRKEAERTCHPSPTGSYTKERGVHSMYVLGYHCIGSVTSNLITVGVFQCLVNWWAETKRMKQVRLLSSLPLK